MFEFCSCLLICCILITNRVRIKQCALQKCAIQKGIRVTRLSDHCTVGEVFDAGSEPSNTNQMLRNIQTDKKGESPGEGLRVAIPESSRNTPGAFP